MRSWGYYRSLLRQGLFIACIAPGLTAASSERVAAAALCKGQRLALVIGNKAYPDSEVPLKGTAESARRIAEALRAVGFDVELGEDLTKAKMDADVRALEAKMKPGAAVFLYFSGFGVQAGGHTFLLPVDASIWSEGDIAANGINIDRVLTELDEKKVAVEVLVIDAARRNPFERRFRATGSAGLAPPSAISGNLVALYSAAPHKVFDASDLSAEPFADDIAREITAPHATAQEAFRQVRAMVARTSRAGQAPWGFSTLSDDLPLDIHDCSGTSPAAPPQVTKADPPEPAAPPPVRDAAEEPAAGPQPPHAEAPQDPPPVAEPKQAAKPGPLFTPVPPPSEALRQDEEAMVPPPSPPTPAPQPSPADDKASRLRKTVGDSKSLDEIRTRLFEQNLDPGEAGSEQMRNAIKTFEQRAGLSDDGRPTLGLLDALRATKSLSPWAAIAVADDVKSWGMAWDKPTRAEALAEAKTRCGKRPCNQQMSFYGQSCGAFALSPRHWIVAHRDGGEAARKAALSDCSSAGAACRVIGSVCADGSDKID